MNLVTAQSLQNLHLPTFVARVHAFVYLITLKPLIEEASINAKTYLIHEISRIIKISGGNYYLDIYWFKVLVYR